MFTNFKRGDLIRTKWNFTYSVRVFNNKYFYLFPVLEYSGNIILKKGSVGIFLEYDAVSGIKFFANNDFFYCKNEKLFERV